MCERQKGYLSPLSAALTLQLENSLLIGKTVLEGRMNLGKPKRRWKSTFSVPFFFFFIHLLIFLFPLLYALNKTPVLEKILADHQTCSYALSVPKLSVLFCCSTHNCSSESVFPETSSLETLNTILNSSLGIGPQSEGWSSWLNRLFLCRASMVLQLIKLFSFRALQGKSARLREAFTHSPYFFTFHLPSRTIFMSLIWTYLVYRRAP